jgi:hypothetical protein
MALKNQSLILYNFTVTPANSSIDFRNAPSGPIIQATIKLGFYSLSTLLSAIAAALVSADPDNEYFATADRTIAGNTQNRVTISTLGTHFELLFGTGPRVASSIAPYIGFNPSDYTGSTTYTGSSTSGTVLIPDYPGYNYLGPEFNQKNFGVVNVSASGQKEAVVFALQQFITVTFKFEQQNKWITQWLPLVQWMIQQQQFDFTPDYTQPDVFYSVTLESSEADGQGLAFMPTEMLPDFPFYYDTGEMRFRIQPS